MFIGYYKSEEEEPFLRLLLVNTCGMETNKQKS